MPTRVTVSLPEPLHKFADDLVEKGTYATFSAVVAAGLNALHEKHAEHDLTVQTIASEIRRRAELPDDAYLPHNGGDFSGIFEEVLSEKPTE